MVDNKKLEDGWEDVPLDSEEDGWEDVPLEMESPNVSGLESIARGAFEGATYGGSGEVVGGIKAIASSPKSIFETFIPTSGATEGSLGYDIENPSGSKEDFYKRQQEAALALTQGQEEVAPQGLEALLGDYRKGRDSWDESNKIAEEENRELYLTGELGGGLLSSPFTGGAGAVGAVGRVGLKKALPSLIKAGAKQGAASGLGYSEADLTKGEFADAAVDTGLGAVVGGGTGAAIPVGLPAIGRGAKKTASWLSDIFTPNFVKDAGKAFNYGTKGVPVFGEKGKELLKEDTLDVAQTLLDKFGKQYREGSKMVNKALNAPNVKKINYSNQLRELQKSVGDANLDTNDAKVLLATINRFEDTFTKETVDSGTLRALADLKKKVNTQTAKSNALNEKVSFTAPEILEDLGVVRSVKRGQNALGEDIADVITSNIPEDKIVTETLSKFQNLSLSDLFNVKQDINQAIAGSGLDKYSKKIAQRLVDGIDNMLQSNSRPDRLKFLQKGSQKIKDQYDAGGRFSQLLPKNVNKPDMDIDLGAELLQTNFKTDEGLNRVFNKYMSIPDTDLLAKAKSIADRQELSRILSKDTGVISALRNTFLRGAQGVGEVTGDKLKTVNNFSKTVIGMSDEALVKVADIMESSNQEWMKGWSGAIRRSQSDPQLKNKVLWSLSQQPAFREFVTELINSEDNINEEDEL